MRSNELEADELSSADAHDGRYEMIALNCGTRAIGGVATWKLHDWLESHDGMASDDIRRCGFEHSGAI